MWVLYTSELQRSTNYICKFQNIDIEITVNTFCITALYWVDLKIPEKVFNPLVHILQNPGNQSTIITLLYCRWNRGSSSGYHAQITGCKSAIRSLLLSLGFTGYSAEISGYSKKKKKRYENDNPISEHLTRDTKVTLAYDVKDKIINDF